MEIELLPKLDEKATCRNVHNFFKYQLENIVLMSGHRMTDLQSPSFDSIPSGSHVNSAELKVVNGLDAQNVVKSVYDALHHIDDLSYTILTGIYLKYERWVDIQPYVGREHTSFGKYKNRALVAFAYSFEAWQILNNCDHVIDLKETV